MFVQETRLQSVLSGASQYRVPLYQRPYSWTPKQLRRLWDDLVELTDQRQATPDATHFTGSLVLSMGQIGPAASEFLVVDGQQRLTTLSVLLCAIRDHYRKVDGDESQNAARIHETYLIDRFRSGDDRLKLIPTQADRDAYRSIIDGNTDGATNTGVMEAYRFFRAQLHAADDPEDDTDIQRIEAAALTGLAFVSITADANDNVYRIFESLNNTGMKLTQGDLLRNYLFMRLGSDGESVYDSWWLPMQRNLSSSDLEVLFWIDYVWNEPTAKQSEIYSLQVNRLRHLAQPEIVSEIKRYSRMSSLLRLMRHPEEEQDRGVRVQLDRLKAWGLLASDPMVLRLLHLRDIGALDDASTARGLHLLQSFMIRRVLIGASANSLGRIMQRATFEIGTSEPISGLHEYLSTGRKYFATDAQLADAVVSRPFYFSGRPNQRKAILGWLEEATPLSVASGEFRGKEQVDLSSTTIEHVMPQSLNPVWREELSADLGEYESADVLHDSLVHTLANLTLTGYNSELSNAPYSKKRELLEGSGLRLNAEIARHDEWTRTDILQRGRILASRISELWAGPIATADVARPSESWSLVNDVVAAIPEGRWASYGDVAAATDTHPVPLGQYLGRVEVPGAWRVLQRAGTISSGFGWLPGSEHDGRDVGSVLKGEGIRFGEQGHADEAQRLSVQELGDLIGLTVRSDVDPDDDSAEDREAFIAELGSRHSPLAVQGVVELMNAWRRLGGYFTFGSGPEASCTLQAGTGPRRPKGIWPLVIYPYGTVETDFQHLAVRAPFDEPELRDELRLRLNRARGVQLDDDRLQKRPPFPIGALADADGRAAVVEALEWFMAELNRYDAESVDAA
ncbi:DUF262 domain-containing protein [Humibacter antri]